MVVNDVVNNPGQLSQVIQKNGMDKSLNQANIDMIGGPGILKEVWSRLKRLELVLGVKRKLTERDWATDNSTPSRRDSVPEQFSWRRRVK